MSEPQSEVENSETPEIIEILHFSKNKTKGKYTTAQKESDDIQDTQEGNEFDEAINILCIIYKNGKMGAAYYNFQGKVLRFYEEIFDSPPRFVSALGLLREVRPKYILTFGNLADPFVIALVDAVTTGMDATTTSNSVRTLPENFFLLSSKDHTYDICKAVISQMNIATNTEEPTEQKKEVYIHSRINFDYRLSVQALGATIKYLEKNWAYFEIVKDELQYLEIEQVSRANHVLIDNSTFQGLNIFSQLNHDAGFKRGLHNASREGLSIYKIFSAHCKSKIGLTTLRSILVNPVNDMDILKARLEFISFVLEPVNKEYIEALQDNIKQIGYDVETILQKIANSRAKSVHWQALYKCIYHSLFINEISSPNIHKSNILQELHNSISPELVGLENSIANGLDFDAAQKYGRPVIKCGLDEILDAKKLRRQDIAKSVTAAARFAVDDLPPFLNKCCVVYLPEMGHLISVKEWKPNCNPDELAHLHFRFMFSLRGTIHYKTPLCVELDRKLGDINTEIIDHENRIVRRLAGFILKHRRDIMEPIRIIGLIDSLISMALEAFQSSYVKPRLNIDNVIEVTEGRHILMERIMSQNQANDFYSGGQYSDMKIITGPNGSGKSMYLKQVALIVFLAHIGSYVPAKDANIAMISSIYSRIQATESATVRLSSFMIDVTQITHTFIDTRPNSLILLDEFGRGTSEEDGLALLGALLRSFLARGNNCPHILVSTHMQQIFEHIPQSSLVLYQKMEYKKNQDGFYFLYKLTEGVSSSFALEIAETSGIDKEVLARAALIMDCINSNTPIMPLRENRQLSALENLKNLDIPQPDIPIENNKNA
ncbi:unnamed protein product [Acanthoscelides obtectus]|uniref:DNA mismatch repair proteins mutS family domain-containing protein n=2 Tax=Acanthoscelides obtectus TaxID=200917 RepID=A0A9P0Q7E6_ACAOB|nr:unnamed protein product [Acanthoscelides obtectus]CAK1689513.1 MutS protein homolog 5 [Acanthoscelides obtectus]